MSKDKFDEKANPAKEGFRFRAMDFLGKKSHIELESNNLAIIEGSKGVLEYSTECIRISLEEFVVSFMGRGLLLKCISPTSLTVQGSILNISFSD